jgi:hypothetical protein
VIPSPHIVNFLRGIPALGAETLQVAAAPSGGIPTR